MYVKTKAVFILVIFAYQTGIFTIIYYYNFFYSKSFRVFLPPTDLSWIRLQNCTLEKPHSYLINRNYALRRYSDQFRGLSLIAFDRKCVFLPHFFRTLFRLNHLIDDLNKLRYQHYLQYIVFLSYTYQWELKNVVLARHFAIYSNTHMLTH